MGAESEKEIARGVVEAIRDQRVNTRAQIKALETVIDEIETEIADLEDDLEDEDFDADEDDEDD